MQEKRAGLKSLKKKFGSKSMPFTFKEGQDKRQYVDNIRDFYRNKNGCQLVYGMYDSTISSEVKF
jgi:hypothetical protein